METFEPTPRATVSQLESTSREKDHEADYVVGITNILQMNLATDLHPDKEADEAYMIFSTSDESLRFRNFIKSRPDLIEKYEKEPEETMQIIKEGILH